MEQLAIVARLKPGAEPEAADLIANGPPFDPTDSGLDCHTVYLSADEVVFVFEGHEVEWIVDKLVDDPFHWLVSEALERWRPLLEDQPRIARPAYVWRREGVPKVASFHG
jgi:hypothetical protein